MTEKIVEVKNLTKKYGRHEAVKGIDIDIFKGEVFGLLGPNGAGKTSTLEILEGLRRPSGGTIKLFGKEIKGKMPRDVKEKIGVVLQNTAFLDHLKVKEIVELFASFFEKPLNAKKVLELVQLGDMLNAFPEMLSGGQHQRLALAVALINDPELIFLDEPTTGLDPQSRESIWRLIEKLREEGKTFFLTTHYMEEAQRLCDRVTIIDNGKIVATSSPAELIRRYGGRSTVAFYLSRMPSGEEMKELETVLKFKVKKIGDRYEAQSDDLVGTLEKIVTWSKKHTLSLLDVLLMEPTLQDVFLNLTGRELRD